jgi:hypothetical protein
VTFALDKTIAAMLLVPVIGLVIPAAIFFRKLPDTGLTPTEKELMTFSNQPLVVSQPGRMAVYSGLECPLPPPAVTKDVTNKANTTNFPPGSIPTPNAAAALQKNRPVTTVNLPEVSMIYSDGQALIAIVDGHVLREGTGFGSSKVIKIEKTRVLLRTSGKDLWLNIN